MYCLLFYYSLFLQFVIYLLILDTLSLRCFLCHQFLEQILIISTHDCYFNFGLGHFHSVVVPFKKVYIII